MSLVEVSELVYSYPGTERPALDGVDLQINAGEMVLLAGLSGSGKSTLLRALSGLVPHFYGGSFGGRVSIAGLDTRAHRPGEIAAHAGLLAQDPETQAVMGTPRAELAFPLENRGVSGIGVARAVEEAALALGIEQLLDRPTDALSGGELQRVALGATLSCRPALVCLDEPTSQLDPVAGADLISLLSRLNAETDLAVVVAEQRIERYLDVADRVVVLDAGRIAFDGLTARFLHWALAAAPLLVPPGARLLAAVGVEPVPGVKRARATLRRAGYSVRVAPPFAGRPSPGATAVPAAGARPGARWRAWRRGQGDPVPALSFRHVWHELREGPTVLHDIDLRIGAGERVALMGRNGAGKSTLLRHGAGLMAPTRGSVSAAGRVALLLQNPGDYLVHDTVARELDDDLTALRRQGLEPLAARHPRDLSGGERQRLALAVVLGHGGTPAPAVLALDEPTRGMDHAVRRELVTLLGEFAGAVIVATHDPEFAAAFAQRVLLLAGGRVIADGPAAEVLCGGAYFATETARILGGVAGALRPEDGARMLQAGAR